MKSVGQALVFGLLLALLGGCAGPRAFREGEALMRQGRHDEAVAKFSEALSRSPESREYRLNLLKAKTEAARKYLANGRTLVIRQQYDQALADFRQAQALDPSMTVVGQEIARTETLLRSEKLISEAETFYRERRFGNAKNNLTQALEIFPGNPGALALLDKVQKNRNTVMDGFELDVSSDTPITLTFKSAKTKEVFNILSKLSGINFIFDEEMKEQSISLALEQASFAQAMELLLKMNDLGKKVLNSKTIIIYSNTKEKDKQYEDHIIQTFYLSNIDAKKAVNLLRTMLQLRKVYVHEELNALVVRDKPAVIKLAQQILEASDRGDSEVVLDLELIEITHNNELKIGPTLSNYSVSVGMSKDSQQIVADTLTAGTTVKSSAEDADTPGAAGNLVQSLNNLQTFYTLPTATYDVLRRLTDSEILANPSIRVKNKEKAKVHIGSREPVITVTINGDQTSENIQYVDVGVKLDVEPTIQLDNTVVTKLNLEVSNATRLTALQSGTTPLVISTTNASTALILKDGEQTVIGGLLRDDQSKSKSTIPFLGEIPLLGKLFTGHSNTKTKREILLSITPHIVKNIDMPNADVASIWSGGEDDLKAGPNFGSFAAFKPELEEPPLAAAPALMPPASLAGGETEGAAPPDEPAVAEIADYAEAVAAPEEGGPAGTIGRAAINEGMPLPGPLPEMTPMADSGPLGSSELPVPGAPPAGAPGPANVPVPALPVPGAPAETIEQVTLTPSVLPQVAERGRVYFSGSTLVKVGEEIVLDVLADEVTDLYSAPLFVRYDPNQLAFVRAEEGDFLKQGGQSTLFTTSVNNDKGELIVGYKQGLGGAGVSGGGKLFRLVFKAVSAGSTQVGFDRINFRNPAGNRLAVLPMSFTLEVR
jgi:general secretion pathway protein D